MFFFSFVFSSSNVLVFILVVFSALAFLRVARFFGAFSFGTDCLDDPEPIILSVTEVKFRFRVAK